MDMAGTGHRTVEMVLYDAIAVLKPAAPVQFFELTDGPTLCAR
jgi:hypothetical protein